MSKLSSSLMREASENDELLVRQFVSSEVEVETSRVSLQTLLSSEERLMDSRRDPAEAGCSPVRCVKQDDIESRSHAGTDLGIGLVDPGSGSNDPSECARSVSSIAERAYSMNGTRRDEEKKCNDNRSSNVKVEEDRDENLDTLSEIAELRNIISGQNLKIEQLEEIITRRNKQVEQLAMSMTDYRQDLYDNDAGVTEKKVLMLEHQCEAYKRHERELESQLVMSQKRIEEMYSLQCGLTAANEKLARLQRAVASMASEHDKILSGYQRAVSVLCAMDADEYIASKEGNFFRPEASQGVQEASVQTPDIFLDRLVNCAVISALKEVSAVKDTESICASPSSYSSPASTDILTGPHCDTERRALLLMLRKERRLRKDAERQVHELLSFQLEQQATKVDYRSQKTHQQALIPFLSGSVYDFS